MSKYYIDTDYVEHGCCWDATICCKVSMGEGQYAKVKLMMECMEEDAEFICNALNEAERVKSKGG